MVSRRSVVVLCTVALLSGCKQPALAPAGVDLPELKADRVMYGVEFASTSDGVKRARTHADTAYSFTRMDSATLDLRGMRITMFDEAGVTTGSVVAKSGLINTRTKAMVARGNVVMNMKKEGKRVETQELHYDQDMNRIWSRVATKIISRDGGVQYVDSFESDTKFNNFHAKGARGSTGIIF
ncbi:MAG: LPS export ABC transporter periplasmic protein LptC [Longimicrobiales bacterium]